MYLVGAQHPNRDAAAARIERLISAGTKFVTDAEVLQEILHRYYSIRRPDAIQPAFEVLEGLAEEVFDLTLADVEEAKRLLLAVSGLSARDAAHISTMKRNGVSKVFSFDSGFDLVPGIERIVG